MPPKRQRVCPQPGCWRLQGECPDHDRPTNARWSKDRDGAAQNRFRAAVLARDGHQCTRCGATDNLVAHHIRPGYEPSAGKTLCDSCHRYVDTHAR